MNLRLLAALTFFLICGIATASRAEDLLMRLEAGQFEVLTDTAGVADRQDLGYAAALIQFYRGELRSAWAETQAWPPNMPASGLWLKTYLNENVPFIEQMAETQSPHFTLRTAQNDRFLQPYALEALEQAYAELGNDFGVFPKEKIPVEIYPDPDSFSRASTLSRETLDRSGAIGICKFRRLMILSPSQLAFGYRWLDTLAHEYTHYLVNVLSAGRCPLWMHEGIAKHFESRWRLGQPAALTPGNRSELVRALKSDQLISFSRMEPSMVYLENQTQVRQAFSQVCHAIEVLEKNHGRSALLRILTEMALGKSRQAAFQSVLKMDVAQFEAWWKEELKKSDWNESPGAAPDILRYGKSADEVEELASVDVQAHIRLGERLRQAGQPDAALIQYRKALNVEPNNPVVLSRLAKLLLQRDQIAEASELLERSILENPNYEPSFALLGEMALHSGDLKKAKALLIEANAINPYHPAIHEGLLRIHESHADSDGAQRERQALEALQNRATP